jgi:hypothetical protein
MSDIFHKSNYSILKNVEHVHMKENCMNTSYEEVKSVTGLVSFVFWGTDFV